jgi:hypothetical protein
MSNALFGGYIADPTSGHFISQKHAAVAQIIHDWNPDLSLVWLPPDVRIAGDEGKEFAIIHTSPENFKQYVVCYADANQIDERLVAKLYEMDSRKNDVLSKIEYGERAARLLETKMMEDAAAERQDLIATVISSPLHSYKLSNGRRINS